MATVQDDVARLFNEHKVGGKQTWSDGLGRSLGKYQSFFCFNANNRNRGCTNKGYTSARISADQQR